MIPFEGLKETFAAQILEEFKQLCSQDIEGAEYKIGEKVGVIKDSRIAHVGVIQAVNLGDEFEYAVEGYPWLVWESELVAVNLNA